jgi:tetratricopeptide (TPR) repeat protein
MCPACCVAAARQPATSPRRTACRTVLAIQPGNADASCWLVSLRQPAGRRAIDLLRQAIARNPARADFHGNLGAILGRLGRLDEAIACFRAAIRLEPAAVAGRHPQRAAGQGDLGGAVASFRRASSCGPAIAAQISAMRCASDRLDRAAASPRSDAARSNLAGAAQSGVVLFTQGRLAEAEAAFRTALRLKADSQLAFRQLALVLIAAGRLDEAVRFLIEPVRALRRPGAAGDSATFRQTNRVKLQHDADQLSYLVDRQLAPGSLADVIAEHRALLARISHDRTFEIAPADARLAA